MKKILLAFLFCLGSLLSFATGVATAPPTQTTDPVKEQTQKTINLLEGKTENLPAKEAKKLEKLKKQWAKIKEQTKKSPHRARDMGDLFMKIGIVLVVVGLLVVALQFLGVGTFGIYGSGTIILGLILYLVGKYAF